MKIEETIELAMKAIMTARSGVTVPVVRYRDRLTAKGDKWIDCHAMPISRMSPNHNLYRTSFELTAVSKSQQDLRSNDIDALVSECADEINETLTVATLQSAINVVDAASGISIDGLVPTEGAESDGDYQQFVTATDIFLTYTKPA